MRTNIRSELSPVEPELSDKLTKEDMTWLLRKTDARPEGEVVKIAKDPNMVKRVEEIASGIKTKHTLYLGDSRDMHILPSGSASLAITSPPYWTIKKYRPVEGQLGVIEDYDLFVKELGRVWSEVHRLLTPGGRLIVIVGDVLLSRRIHGRHEVIPLHADIQKQCTSIGFENLAPIIWYKIGNVSREVPGGGGMLGKPYQPNAIVKNDIEYILMFRKEGYRQPSRVKMKLSTIPKSKFGSWFVQVWQLPGTQAKDHPAPFPLALVERLVRMYSFVDDIVLDPFVGTGTTMLAAGRWGRNSIGIDIDRKFIEIAWAQLRRKLKTLISENVLELRRLSDGQPLQGMVGT